MKRIHRRATPKNSGLAMVGTLLVLLGVTALIVVGTLKSGESARQGGGSVSEESSNELAMALRRGNQYQAQTLSETGIRLAIQWLVDQTTTPNNTTAFAPSSVSNFFGASTQNSTWSKLTFNQGPTNTQLSGVGQMSGEIWVKFYPYTSNSSGGRKMFAIESEGRIGGRTYLSRVFVRQNTFARFAYFSDVCPTSWWVTGLNRFQGPVHINGNKADGTGIDTAARMKMIWRNGGGQTQAQRQLFTYNDIDYLTTAMPASQLEFYRTDGNTTWTETPGTTSSNWAWITAASRPPLGGQAVINLPAATTEQRSAALGTGTVPTAPVGVVVPGVGAPSAGVFVKGDVRDFNLKVGTANTTQILEFVQYNATSQKDVWSVVTIDPVANSTTLLVKERTNTAGTWDISTATGTWSTTVNTTYTGVPNGVVYVDGNIGEQGTGTRRGGLSGVVANSVVTSGVVTRTWAMTIATESTKTVNINGGIVYQNLISNSTNVNNYLSTSATANSTSGILGLVAGSLQLVDNDDSGNPLTNISVHGACMAYNTFDATNATTRTAGAFNLIGGYIVKTNGTFGTALPNGTAQNGFLVNRNYDQRLPDSPPPSYPATERSYLIVSYQRAVTPLN